VLTELRVRDLAVIADVTLPLESGFNVLTGETGAGKSLLVDALALLLGERANADVVRSGAEKTVVEGAFEFTSTALSRLLPPLTALGVELEDGRLVVKREVGAEGRSRAWVNGSPTTVSVLARLGSLLVDLHGQHETQSLLSADTQRDLLDAWSDAEVERAAVRDAHERWQGLVAREEDLTAKQEEVRRKSDYLRHVVDEIGAAAPKVGEDDALAASAQLLANAEERGRLGRELAQAVDAGPLARAAKLLGALERLDPSVAPWRELLDGAFAHVEELGRAASGYVAGIASDPAGLTAIEHRRDVLFRLAQKYGPTLPDVLATRAAAARELDLLDTADLDLRNIGAEREAAATDFLRACTALSARRRAGAGRLARAVSDLLPALGMPGGKLTVRLVNLVVPQATGAESVVFEVELNTGLEGRPLARVASGGELSRLMLALKVVLANHDAVPTLVFDEVDQGIGGEAGVRVGEALAAVARGEGRQALVITHLPQIAVHAGHHVVVAKGQGGRGGVATSDVTVVEGDARRREVARMLGRSDMASALEHATQLLKTASVPSASRDETLSPRAPGRPRR
jgi:DNA repair protein RecN (Recombination protein N)